MFITLSRVSSCLISDESIVRHVPVKRFSTLHVPVPFSFTESLYSSRFIVFSTRHDHDTESFEGFLKLDDNFVSMM